MDEQVLDGLLDRRMPPYAPRSVRVVTAAAVTEGADRGSDPPEWWQMLSGSEKALARVAASLWNGGVVKVGLSSELGKLSQSWLVDVVDAIRACARVPAPDGRVEDLLDEIDEAVDDFGEDSKWGSRFVDLLRPFGRRTL